MYHSRHRGGTVFRIFENMNQVDGLSLISMPLMFPPGTLILGLKKNPILFWLVVSNPSPKYESHLESSSRGPRREQVNKNPGFLVIFPFVMYSIHIDENPHCWTKHSLVSTPTLVWMVNVQETTVLSTKSRGAPVPFPLTRTIIHFSDFDIKING